MRLVRETRARRDVRPRSSAILRECQGVLQALNAKNTLWREADLLREAGMERSAGQARLSRQLRDATAAVERQAGAAILSGAYPCQKGGNSVQGGAARRQLTQSLHEQLTLGAERRFDRYGSIREIR